MVTAFKGDEASAGDGIGDAHAIRCRAEADLLVQTWRYCLRRCLLAVRSYAGLLDVICCLLSF